MERITTTERPLRELVAIAIGGEGCATADWCRARGVPFCECLKTADAVLPVIERERVRVVEGLVATIKAIDTYHVVGPNIGIEDVYEYRRKVLAVVEAAK